MQEKLDLLDDRAVDMCEKFSHMTQRIFGITCFKLARQLFILSFAMLLLYSILSFRVVGPEPFFIIITVTNIIFLGKSMMLSAKLAFAMNTIYEKGLFNTSFVNKLRILMKSDRIRMVVASIILGLAFYMVCEFYIFFLLVVMMTTNAFGDYFIACTPLPPCKGKVKEWLESFGKQLVPIEVRHD